MRWEAFIKDAGVDSEDQAVIANVDRPPIGRWLSFWMDQVHHDSPALPCGTWWPCLQTQAFLQCL